MNTTVISAPLSSPPLLRFFLTSKSPTISKNPNFLISNLHSFPIAHRNFKISSKRFSVSPLRATHVDGFSNLGFDNHGLEDDGGRNGGFPKEGSKFMEFLERLEKGIHWVRSFLPGGSWWRLPDFVEDDRKRPNRVTVFFALRQMWGIVAEDRWVIFAGFASLMVAAIAQFRGKIGRFGDLTAQTTIGIMNPGSKQGLSEHKYIKIINNWDYHGKRTIISILFTMAIFECNGAMHISEISVPHYLTASIFSAQSGETVAFHKNARLLILMCCISGICSGLRGFYFGIANMILVKRMREILFSALLFQDISFFDMETVGDLTSRLGSDCQQVSRVIGNDLNSIARNVLQGTGALFFLITLSWPLALSTLVICSCFATIMFFYGRYQKQAAKSTQEFVASANEVAQETFSLIRTVRVYGTEKPEFGRYTQWLMKLADVNYRQSVAYGFWLLGFNTLYHATQVIAVLIGGASIMAGHITTEKLTKFILYSEWLIYSTWFVGDNWSSLMQSVGASEKVFQLMDLLPSKQFISEGLKLPKVLGRVEFVDVSFSYPSRAKIPALQHVTVSINPEEVVAIVGLSGSGKSTLVNLLLRLYEPTSGQILIDGLPLDDMDIKWLRERIGYLGQEPRLFRMDISSNIRYGCTREVSHEEVEWAAKQAYAHDFIMSLPDRYATLVDDELLSGGQKQRIAIARALLRNPTILVLDEATSALDAESEHYVKGVLRAVKEGTETKRTVIVIAHRLSTIRDADRIVVMDKGRIVEIGDHTELLRKDGLYARLTKRQMDALV